MDIIRACQFTICLCVGPCFACAEETPNEVQKLPSQLPKATAQVLRWLPCETETVIVTQGPYVIEKPLAKDKWKDESFEAQLRRFVALGLYAIHNGKHVDILAGRKVVVAVEGSCKFRRPKDIGVFTYSGCHVLVFDQELGKSSQALFQSMQSKGGVAQKFAGLDVVVVEQKREQDTWTWLVAHPKPNVLVFATDRSYLKTFLARMTKPPRIVAFPSSNPAWKYIDVKSSCWGICRFGVDKQQDKHFKLFQDPDAKYFAFSYSPKRSDVARAWYFTPHENAVRYVESIKGLFTSSQVKPTVTKVGKGVVAISQSVKNTDAASSFLMLIVLRMGHGFFI